MFCNKCGKTLNPEAKTCPNCGQPVGDSRFEGSGYTSSQVRFVPESAGREGYAPYTKTTYSSAPDEGGDVYSRTTYRPALAEDEGGRTTGFVNAEPEPEAPQEPEPQPEGEARPEAGPHPEAWQPPRFQAAPDDRDALGIEIKPLEPIRKTGISPEVQRYIQQMNQKKNRQQHRKHAEHPEGEPQGEEAAIQEEEQSEARSGSSLAKWAIRVGGVVVVLALLIWGVLYVADKTASRAKIPGVTYTLYTEGLSLIKQHDTDEYRTQILKLWRADQTGQAAQQQQDGESAEIKKLLPEKPLENDQLYLDTLLAVQDAISGATDNDALILMAGNTDTSLLSQQSTANWQHINENIAALEAATTPEQLTSIKGGAPLTTIATPTPAPTATPSPYKTLKNGMKNNKQVKNLQDRLYKLGWFNGVRDGDFGPATKTAVKRFQSALGIPDAQQDGIATPELQEKLFADDAPRGDGRQPSATASADSGETPAPPSA